MNRRTRDILVVLSRITILIGFVLEPDVNQALAEPVNGEDLWHVRTADHLPDRGPDEWIKDLTIAEDGTVWFTTRSEELVRYRDGHSQTYTNNDIGFGASKLLAIEFDSDGTLWVGSENGLASFRDDTWRVYTTNNSDLPGDRINCLTAGGDGTLWACTESGLARLHHGEWSIDPEPTSSYAPKNDIKDIQVIGDGTVWVHTAWNVMRYANGSWNQPDKPGDRLESNSVRVIAAGLSGYVWIAKQAGLSRYRAGVWEDYSPYPSLQHYKIFGFNALEVASDGSVWAAAAKGLYRLAGDTWTYFNTANSEIPDNEISVIRQAPNGDLWMGTHGAGLVRYSDGQWESYTKAGRHTVEDVTWEILDTKNSTLPFRAVTDMETDGNGDLWIASVFYGIARFDGKNWEYIDIPGIYAPTDVVRNLGRDPWGLIFAMSATKLIVDEPGTWAVADLSDALLIDERISRILYPAAETLWIATNDRVIRYQDREQKSLVPPGGALSALATQKLVALTPDGSFWIGANRGLAQFADGKWTLHTLENNAQPSPRIKALAVDGNGVLWVGTKNGLFRMTAGKLSAITTDTDEQHQRNVNAITFAANGDIWVAFYDAVGRYRENTWELFTKQNSDLPFDDIADIAASADGSIWIINRTAGIARMRYYQ